MGMDLDLDLVGLARPGRRAKPLAAAIVRPLRASDLALLAEERGTKAPALKRVTERHHRLARLLADGVGPAEASLVTGYCISRISILQGDPTFQELVRHYTRVQNDAYADLHQRLAGLSVDAADILMDRMEDEPDELSVSQLQSIIQLGADRTGYGPQQTNVSFTGNIADRMDAARKRAQERKLKDVTPADQDRAITAKSKEVEDERSAAIEGSEAGGLRDDGGGS